MSNQELHEIAKANRELSVIKERHVAFNVYIANHGVPDDVPTKIEFSEQQFHIDCFGYVAKASPRYVIDTSNKTFAVEYLFLISQGDETEEVTRFYLTSYGQICESLDLNTRICDYDTRYLASEICRRVAIGILRSSFIQPASSIAPVSV